MEKRTARGKAVKGLFLWMILMSLLFIRKGDVNAARLEDEKLLTKNSTTIKRDINGDGKTETIKIKTTKLDSYFYNKIKVYVNGKLALSKSIRGCSVVSVRYISCSKKKNYLQIIGGMDGGYMFLNKIYYISGSKLTEAADLGQADNMSAQVTKVTGNSITVRFSVQPCETGRVEWSFVYRPDGKKLALKNNTAKVTSTLGNLQMNDGYQKYFKKNQFVVANGRTFYTSTSLKKKAYTTKQGDVLTLYKVKVANGKMYLSFKKNGKVGWCRIISQYDPYGYWFYGVNNRLAG